jgi:hypothetical protein
LPNSGRQFPDAIVGGTHDVLDNTDGRAVSWGIEENENLRLFDLPEFRRLDRLLAARVPAQVRLLCRAEEGRQAAVGQHHRIRSGAGEPWPKHIHLLDNDFFGQPREQWEARIDEIRTGGFKVCLNQGINTRMIDDESAKALASIPYYDDGFKTRRLYTAWDNIGDEERFFRGVDTLERHGIPPRNLLVYMLVGYDKRETWERCSIDSTRWLSGRSGPIRWSTATETGPCQWAATTRDRAPHAR